MTNSEQSSALALWPVAGAAVLFASAGIASRLASTVLALLLGGVLLLPAAAGNLAPGLSWPAMAAFAYLGLAGTALAYALFVSTLGQVGTAAALAVLLVQPLVAVLAGAILLGEPANAGVLGGVALLVLALATRAFGPFPGRARL